MCMFLLNILAEKFGKIEFVKKHYNNYNIIINININTFGDLLIILIIL